MPQIVMYKPGRCYPPQAEGSKVGFDRLMLKSGVNNLSDDDYLKLLDHPDYPAYIERGALVVHEPKAEVETIPLSDIPANLSAYNVDEAEEIIDETHDIDILKRWSSADARVTVKRAITQRIKDLGGDT